MRLTTDELLDIITEASLRLHKDIRESYNKGGLENYLITIGMEDLIPVKKEILYDSNPEGKIIIFGDSQVKDNDILGCLKELGIQKNRVELHLNYEDAIRYPFEKLQYNYNYRLILFGPIPHSVQSKEDSSNIIKNLEEKDVYTKIIRLTDGHGLKISKSNLKTAVAREIETGYLAL